MERLLKIKKDIDKKPILSKSLKVLFWIFLLFVGFIGNDVYDYLIRKPSLDIIMPETFEDDGSFEITLVNGEISLEDVQVKVKSCFMRERWKHYFLDDLPQNKEYLLDFEDELTFNKSKLIDCRNNPLENLEDRAITIDVYRNITSGELLSPSVEEGFNMCGYCYWNISVQSNQKNFSFYEKMFLPVEIIFESEALLKIDKSKINSPDIVYYSPIKVTFIGVRELEIAEG